MPTGYTSDIENGITFPQFAMSCARAFGALIDMRDEPHNTLIPDELIPSDYHIKALRKAESELAELDAISINAATLNAKVEYEDTIAHNHTYTEKRRDLKSKYIEMLTEVQAWNPPTKDHEGLKKFMIEQIEMSIKSDCIGYFYADPVLLTGKEWIEKQRGHALTDIEYHSKNYREECERTAQRNNWIRDLRKSLKEI